MRFVDVKLSNYYHSDVDYCVHVFFCCFFCCFIFIFLSFYLFVHFLIHFLIYIFIYLFLFFKMGLTPLDIAANRNHVDAIHSLAESKRLDVNHLHEVLCVCVCV